MQEETLDDALRRTNVRSRAITYRVLVSALSSVLDTTPYRQKLMHVVEARTALRNTMLNR